MERPATIYIGTSNGFDFEVESHEAAQSGDKHVHMNCVIHTHMLGT